MVAPLSRDDLNARTYIAITEQSNSTQMPCYLRRNTEEADAWNRPCVKQRVIGHVCRGFTAASYDYSEEADIRCSPHIIKSMSSRVVSTLLVSSTLMEILFTQIASRYS